MNSCLYTDRVRVRVKERKPDNKEGRRRRRRRRRNNSNSNRERDERRGEITLSEFQRRFWSFPSTKMFVVGKELFFFVFFWEDFNILYK